MDFYDEKEHVISSDEYSDDDDDDEALMNDAIRAGNNIHNHSADFDDRNKQLKWVDQKQKELSSLIRRNKISIIYKNKSIRWLNNKKQRERYKKFIYQNKGKNSIQFPDLKCASRSTKTEVESTLIQDAVSVANSENYVPTIAQDIDEKELLPTSTKKNTISTEITTFEHQNRSVRKPKDLKAGFEKTIGISKRARSLSPVILNESSEVKVDKNERKNSVESPQFYKSVNEMFPKFDNIATVHIDAITNNTLVAVEDKMKSLLNEINTLSEILHTKEMEWNRLLHLKMIKEEIYSRLSQKRYNLRLKENYTKLGTENNLVDLKELELYLSEKKPISSNVNLSAITIQKLIEKRANMNTEDLEREKNNTSRLHSLLVSRKMLHEKESSKNISNLSNGEKINTLKTSKSNELLKELDDGVLISNRGRQGEFRDVKSIIADFRLKNPEILPPVGKRIKSNEFDTHHNFSIPLHEKNSSPSQYLHISKEHQSDLYPQGNSTEEISITPIGRVKNFSSDHYVSAVDTINSHYNLRSEENFLRSHVKKDFDGKQKNIEYPLCQECKTSESRFVCAGCGNQWYCSKKCQVSAWDRHSELCME